MLGRKWLAVAVGVAALALPLLASQPEERPSVEPAADIDEKAVAAIRAAGGDVEIVNDGLIRTAVAVKFSFPRTGYQKGFSGLLCAFPHLRRLNLRDPDIGDEDLKCLDVMHDLESLVLFPQADVTDEGLKHLRGLNNLRELDLDNCAHVADAGMRIVGTLRSLENLDVGETHVTDKGLEPLIGLPDLRTLSLIDTEITDAGVERLTRMKRLEDLDLSFNDHLTDKSLEFLVRLKSLRRLGIVDAGMTQEGIAAFRKRRPDVGLLR